VVYTLNLTPMVFEINTGMASFFNLFTLFVSLNRQFTPYLLNLVTHTVAPVTHVWFTMVLHDTRLINSFSNPTFFCFFCLVFTIVEFFSPKIPHLISASHHPNHPNQPNQPHYRYIKLFLTFLLWVLFFHLNFHHAQTGSSSSKAVQVSSLDKINRG